MWIKFVDMARDVFISRLTVSAAVSVEPYVLVVIAPLLLYVQLWQQVYLLLLSVCYSDSTHTCKQLLKIKVCNKLQLQ